MKPLQMFLLAADKLIRCRWDGRSERLEVVQLSREKPSAKLRRTPLIPGASTPDGDSRQRRRRRKLKWLPAGGIDFPISGRCKFIPPVLTSSTSVRCPPPSM